jgi:hypothetical protein
MSTARRQEIFRREALDHHAAGQREGRVLRVTAPFVRWLSWTTVGFFLFALVCLCRAPVACWFASALVVREGPAGDPVGMLFLPTPLPLHLGVGTPVRVDLPGWPNGALTFELTWLDVEEIEGDDARQRLGLSVSAGVALKGRGVLARAIPTAGARALLLNRRLDGLTGTGWLAAGTRPAFELLRDEGFNRGAAQ